MDLAYGNANVNLRSAIAEKCRVLTQVSLTKKYKLDEHLNEIRDELERRLDSDAKKVSILVEDKTRVNPEYPVILKELISVIKRKNNSDIYLVLMYGTHPVHTMQTNEQLYGKENLKQVHLINHDCHNDSMLTAVGMLPSGCELKINRYVAESDFVIVLGSVAPHAFAGFTGGPKCILPGISDYESIRANHSMVLSPNADLGVLGNNPIHLQMIAAQQLVQIDFAIQTCRDWTGGLANVFFGDLVESYHDAIQFCKEINGIAVQHKADVVVASCGGLPYDASLYTAQRCVSVASKFVKKHGSIIIIGEFSQGIGCSHLSNCLSMPISSIQSIQQEHIEIGMHSALLMIKNLADRKVLFVTSLDRTICEQHNLVKLESGIIFNKAVSDHISNGANVIILPYTSHCIPIIIQDGES